MQCIIQTPSHPSKHLWQCTKSSAPFLLLLLLLCCAKTRATDLECLCECDPFQFMRLWLCVCVCCNAFACVRASRIDLRKRTNSTNVAIIHRSDWCDRVSACVCVCISFSIKTLRRSRCRHRVGRHPSPKTENHSPTCGQRGGRRNNNEQLHRQLQKTHSLPF